MLKGIGLIFITAVLTTPLAGHGEEIDIYIKVNGDGEIKVDGEDLDLNQFLEKFKNLFAQELDPSRRIKTPQYRIHLAANPRAPSYLAMDVISVVMLSVWKHLEDPHIAYPFVDIANNPSQPIYVTMQGIASGDFNPGGMFYDLKVGIDLKDTGEIDLNTEIVDPEDLPVIVEKLLNRSVDRKAMIVVDGDVLWDDVIKTARMLRGLCAGRIYLMRGKPSSER